MSRRASSARTASLGSGGRRVIGGCLWLVSWLADRAVAELLVGVGAQRVLVEVDAEAGRGRQRDVAALLEERRPGDLLAESLEVDEILGDEEVRHDRRDVAGRRQPDHRAVVV